MHEKGIPLHNLVSNIANFAVSKHLEALKQVENKLHYEFKDSHIQSKQ